MSIIFCNLQQNGTLSEGKDDIAGMFEKLRVMQICFDLHGCFIIWKKTHWFQNVASSSMLLYLNHCLLFWGVGYAMILSYFICVDKFDNCNDLKVWTT